MNRLKKLAATSFVALTVLIQPAFAANKFTKIAGFAAGSAALAAGVYAAVIRDMVKSKTIEASNDFLLTNEQSLERCKKAKKLLQKNKILFTKKEIKDIERVLEEKIPKLTRIINLAKTRQEHNQIMEKVANLYKIQLQYRLKGDMENCEICEKEIQNLLNKDINLAN